MRTPSRDPLELQIKTFVEQVGIQFEELGLPRMAGRSLGWLLICSPPHQRAADLELALDGSKAAICTSLQMLVRFELVERIGLPGERSTYYQIRSGSWSAHLERKVLEMSAMRELAQRGLAILAAGPADRRQRLEELHDMYVFFEQEWPQLIARYRRSHAAGKHLASDKRRKR